MLGPVDPQQSDALPYVAPYDPVNLDLHRTTLKSHYSLVDCGLSVRRVRVGPPTFVPFLTSMALVKAEVDGQSLYIVASEVLIDGQAVPRLAMAVGSEEPPREGKWALTVWEVSSGSLKMVAITAGEGRAVVAVYAGGYKLYLGPPMEGDGLDTILLITFTRGERAVKVENAISLPTYPSNVSAYLVSTNSLILIDRMEVNAVLVKEGLTEVYNLAPGAYAIGNEGIVRARGEGEKAAPEEPSNNLAETTEVSDYTQTEKAGGILTSILIITAITGVIGALMLLVLKKRDRVAAKP